MNTSRLSPMVRDGIFHNLIARDSKPAIARDDGAMREVEVVEMYRCPVCRDLHDWEDDAIECCKSEAPQGLHAEEDAKACPVCGQEYTNPYDAADCCLWKDLDAPTRRRMAARVDAGETWTDVLGVSQ